MDRHYHSMTLLSRKGSNHIEHRERSVRIETGRRFIQEDQ